MDPREPRLRYTVLSCPSCPSCRFPTRLTCPTRPACPAVDPIDRRRYRRRAGPLRFAERTPLGTFAVTVVVDVEPPRKAEADVKRKRAHERAGAVAARLEHGSQRV